jgi:hypothetical protein
VGTDIRGASFAVVRAVSRGQHRPLGPPTAH